MVIQELEDDTTMNDDYLVFFYKRICDHIRLVDLRAILACSKPMREHFRTEKITVDTEPRLVPKGSSKDIKHTRHGKLFSLLCVMTEPLADQYIPYDRLTWVDEIYTSLQSGENEYWMTNYGVEKVGEYMDAATVYLLFKREWDYMGYD
jgi:hypothetical protein